MAEPARAEAKSAAAAKREFKVDLWATDFNTAEIGIMKDTQHEAASHQFTSDMDIIGQVVEDGERTGLIAYREGPWKEETGAKRRLVIKLFSDSLNWHASLDMMVGRSLQLSLGADGVPAPAYSINIARREQLVQLERSAHKLPLIPEKFSFMLDGEAGPNFYRIRRDRFHLGKDYSVFDHAGRRVARLDGKLINLGGAWKVRIKPEHDARGLDKVLTLFAAMLRFNADARKHVGALLDAMAEGELQPQLDHHEEDLYKNPRRMR